jgi:hypothetical protein
MAGSPPTIPEKQE